MDNNSDPLDNEIIQNLEAGEIEDIEPVDDVVESVKQKTLTSKSKQADSKARTASAAVFFNENKSIAGFGNSMRAVFTSVRELVENSLDASEKRGSSPQIFISLRRLNKKELVTLMGSSVAKSKDTRLDFIELSCKDNGIGVKRELIPQLFGTVLAGTKYGAQQTRGRFGLGSKMVLLYAMSTLDLPIQITTRPLGEKKTYRVQLFINLEKNEPIIHSDEVFEDDDEENYFKTAGTEIKVSFTGSWNLAKLYVREYFRQLAIITPYADLRVILPGDESGTIDDLEYKRVVDDLPKPPEVVQVHPWGTDISTFRREIGNSNEDNLVDFLANNFMGVNQDSARKFFKEVNVPIDKPPQELTSQEIRRIVHDGFNRALKESKTVKGKKARIFKFEDPKGDALSPLGSNRLRKGLEKELDPDFVEAITREPRAYEGHPFIIEAAIGYGGGVSSAASSKGVTVVDNRVIYRFANRIPLIFGAGSDLITSVVNQIPWKEYGLTKQTDPLAIAVSLVSTKIPFPETSKEYIDKVEEIGAEVKLVMMSLGRKLKTYLGMKRRRQRERQRKSRFDRFAPATVNNLLSILKEEGIRNPSTDVSSSRIIAALSSGIPRIDSNVLPPSRSIWSQPIWGKPETVEKLQQNNIFEISTFFRSDNQKLSKILGKSTEHIDIIKRRTITELDKIKEVPKLDATIVMDPSTEKRFSGKDERGKDASLPKLTRTLPRRWIRNAYDYLVSPPYHLLKVQTLAVKLVEQERLEVISKLFEEPQEMELVDELSNLLASGTLGDASDIEALESLDSFFDAKDESVVEVVTPSTPVMLDTSPPVETITKKEELKINILELIPHFESFFEIESIKKRKVSTLIDFLFETTHPIKPVNEKLLASSLISNFKSQLKAMSDIFPEYGEIRVSVAGQDWIDGYLRNAFKRRQINTINDIIKTDDSILFEIGELQRLLFTNLMQTLVPSEGTITETDYLTHNAKKKIKLLTKAGIKTVEELAATSSLEIVNDDKFKEYINLLIEESKDRIVEYLTMSNSLGGLNLLKEIDPEDEDRFNDANILNLIDLFTKYPQLKDNHTKERAQYLITQSGRNFEGLPQSFETTLKELDIYTLDQIVLAPNRYMKKRLTPEQKEKIENGLDILMLPPEFISPNLVPSVNLLVDAGVTTLGKFLVWPSDELARVTNTTEEWLNLVKQSFNSKDYSKKLIESQPRITSISHLIGEENVKALQYWGFETISGASQIKWGDIFPNKLTSWSKPAKLNQRIISGVNSIVEIVVDKKEKTRFSKIIEELEDKGVVTVLDFLRSSESSLLGLLRSKRDRNIFEGIYKDLLGNNSKRIQSSSELYRAIKTYFAIERIKSPIVYLSEFEAREIDTLTSQGIRTLNQLILTPTKEIADFLKTTEKKIQNKIDKSTLQSAGTDLGTLDGGSKLLPTITFDHEGVEYFTSDDLQQLYANGYNTLETIYYIADPRTFEVAGLNWEIVNQFKKLLRSPPVLLSWKKKIQRLKEKPVETADESDLFSVVPADIRKASIDEDQMQIPELEYEEVDFYYTLTSKELDALAKKNITRVIDFASAPNEELQKILSWDSETVTQRQKTIILQEVGISLSDVEIFRQDHIDHLRELGLETIEDLYFTTTKESWESEILPYEPIQTIKNVVNLHLNNVVAELGEDVVDLLTSNGVKTILDLLLTGDQILEQKTGLPAERFENLKFALDFGALIEAFDKSIHFTPGLLFHQANKLMENKFARIIDLLVSNPRRVANILEIEIKDAKEIIAGINRTTVIQTEDEKGVPLKDINVFSRSDLRSVAKSGIFDMNEIDTLQELLYQVTPGIFQGEDYVLQQVVDLQVICKIPISKIGDINSEEVEILNSHGILTIGDVLLISFDDLPTTDQRVYEALNYVSASIMDLSPFVAMAKLPAHVVQQTEDTRILINVWLHDSDELDERGIRNIRSLLCMPIKLTSYYKLYTGMKSEIESKTFADLLLEYAPEDHPNTILTNELKKQGSIMKLLKEGSTPISLLDIDAVAFRSLIDNGLTSIEKVILVDDKRLASITGLTQKYWRNLKEIFDPDVFLARLEGIGTNISILGLNSAELAELEQHHIDYVDQTSVYLQPEGVISKIHRFIFSSTVFLIGTPGEKEIAENLGARNIVEAIIVLRKQGASYELIVEMISIAWRAYGLNAIELPLPLQKTCESSKIYSLQDLVTYVIHNPKADKTWVQTSSSFRKSPLLLPIPSYELIDLISVNRCSTIIEALTTPMNMGKITSIREEVKKSGTLKLDEKLELNIKIISRLSKALYNRIEKLDISLQDIISSPRTLDEFKGISQKYLNELRTALRIPMSRMQNDKVILPYKRSEFDKILRLDDLILYYPEIANDNPDLGDLIRSWIQSDDIKIIRDLEIPKEVQLAAETALNIPITGYHELWTASWQGATPFSNVDSKPAQFIKQIIQNSSKSIQSIPQIKSSEYWGLYRNEIYSLSDIILTPEKVLANAPNFTKKRIIEVRDLVIKAIVNGIRDPSKNIRDISDVFGVDKFSQSETSIITLRASKAHPLFPKVIIDKGMGQFLMSPLVRTDVANELKFDDLKSILKLGIYSILDLLNYPENLPQPKSISTYSQRLTLLKNATKTVEKPLQLSKFSFPDEIIQQIDHRNETSRFVSIALQENRPEWQRMLEYPLSYTSLDSGKVKILNKNGIKSTFDLFVAPIVSLTILLNEDRATVMQLLEKLNFKTLGDTVADMPLQIDTIDSISKSGLANLSKQNLFSLLDIGSKIPSGLNRNDEIQLSNFMQILNSDISLLLNADEFSLDHYYKLKNDLNLHSVRDAFVQRNQLGAKQKKLLNSFTPNQLTNLRDSGTKFSVLEILSLNDERLLVKNGIFNFIALRDTSSNDLLNMKIAENKVNELQQILGVGWQSMQSLSDQLITHLKTTNVVSVAEVLSLKLPIELNLPEKVSVKKPIELRTLYSEGKIPDILAKNKIEILSDVLDTDKGLKLYNTNDEDFIRLIKFLHQSVNKIPKIPDKWIPKLQTNGIHRIWQYLLTDTSDLARFCSTSSKAQEEIKGGITLNKVIIKQKLSFKALSESETQILITNGLNSASELTFEGLLTKYTGHVKASSSVIKKYVNAGEIEIWKIASFWELDKGTRWRIAGKYVSIRDLLSDDPKVGSQILSDAISKNYIVETPLNQFVKIDGNLSVHKFAYNYYRGLTTRDSRGMSKLLAPLDIIPSINPSTMINSHKNGITTVLDILLLKDGDNVGKKMGLSSHEFDKILSEIPSLQIPSSAIPKLGLVSTSIISSLIEAKFYSWAQILGIATEEELYGIKGITLKSVQSIQEAGNVSITQFLEIRALGLVTMQKLVKSGITSVFDLILIGEKLKDILGTRTENVLANLTKSNLNKGHKHKDAKLSLSNHIRVADIPKYNELGIVSPVSIVVGMKIDSKDPDIIKGMDDWTNLGKIHIKELKASDVIITKLGQSGFKNLAELIVAPDTSLKAAGLSNKDVDVLRSSLYLPSKRPRLTPKSTPKKSKKVTKKRTSKKSKTVKKTSKKAKSKKTTKKTTGKKKAKKKSKKKKSTKKSTRK
ncbi:MAG: DNA topoisomerase VI subunit B [Candidatus Kariarchaeaceae archaeon]